MTTKPKASADFTGVRVTALVTLYLRWLDSREKQPILADPWAGRTMEGLDFDFTQLHSWAMDAGRFTVAIRTRILDQWVAAYLAAHPDAVVPDLGCGLDSRVFRTDPAAGHAWFDVDLPEVIAVGDQLYPARAGHTSIGASVDDPARLTGVPANRPVAAVADTLLMWLSGQQVNRLIHHIVGHFPHGELAVNTYSKVVKQRLDRRPGPVFGRYGATMGWTLEEPQEIERIDDRLRLVEERSQLDPKHICEPSRLYRSTLSRYRNRCAGDVTSRRADASPRPCAMLPAPGQTSAVSAEGHSGGSSISCGMNPRIQAPARLVPGQQLDPGFGMSSLRFRRFIGGSLTAAFSAHT